VSSKAALALGLAASAVTDMPNPTTPHHILYTASTALRFVGVIRVCLKRFLHANWDEQCLVEETGDACIAGNILLCEVIFPEKLQVIESFR
jgi:hypothetical protein